MTDFASQDSLGSPASFGAFPGALSRLLGPRPRKPGKPDVRYSYRWLVTVQVYQPREDLETFECRDEDERDELRARLGDKYTDLHQSGRPVCIFSEPIIESRQEVQS